MEKLWDLTLLIKNYPALKPWGVRWMIRNRRIPLIKLGRRIYFDPEEISRWVTAHSIPAQSDIPKKGDKLNDR